jgi:lipopolysaccharide/colanic/teichoic acid biosynthesis glycosyltransferase
MTIKIPKKRMLFVCSSLTIVLLSLIFYIVVMAVGFGLPGMATTGNIGFWHQT